MTRTATTRERRAARWRTWTLVSGVAFGVAALAHWPAGEWVAVGVGLLAGALFWRAQVEAPRERERWRQALDVMQTGIVLYGPDDRLVLANADFRRLYEAPGLAIEAGETFEELLRDRVRAGLVPEARGREEAWIAERLAQRQAQDTVSVLREMPDGRWRRITDQRLADGSRLGFSVDVTELVESQRALEAARHDAERAYKLLHDAIEALPDGFALFDAQDRLVLCNQRYREIYCESEPAMQPGATFEQIVRYGLERGQYPQAGATDAEREAWLAERVRRHREPDGRPILQELEGNRWLSIDERKTRDGGIAGVRIDVTELVRTRQELERLSTTDPLTGIGNRRLFDQSLADELRRAQRTGAPLALLMVDVDHFKRYNDRYGHPAGDAALRRIGGLLAAEVRRPGDLAARYGGEEFVLLLPNAGPAAVGRLAERCLASVAAAAIEHGDSPTAAHLTLSIGAATIRPQQSAPPPDAATLLARADAALYEAKQSGRNRVVVATPELP